MSEATRQLYFNISYDWFLYVLFVPVIISFCYGCWKRWQFVKQGAPVKLEGSWGKRYKIFFSQVLGHIRLLNDRGSGFAHFWIFWGMVLLFIGTAFIVVQKYLHIILLKGWFYLIFQSLILDLVGAAGIIGLCYMLIKRYIIKPDRLATAGKGDFITAGLLLIIFLQGFVVEGARIAATMEPFEWAIFSPIGYLFSFIFVGMDMETILNVHRFFWWFHGVLAFIWLAYLPFGRIAHILLGSINIFFSNQEPTYQAIKAMDFESEDEEGESKLGITDASDLNRKERLDLLACVECGRCQEACPAYNAKQPLSPRTIITSFRDGIPIEPDAIWACTTCRACMEVCPMMIEHVPKIVNLRRYLAMEEAAMPELLMDVTRSLEDRFHPFKGVSTGREEWCEELNVPLMSEVNEVDVLYWVGCSTAFDTRNQKIARAMVNIFEKTNTSYAILGSEENCCGDVARRIGSEFNFDMIVQANIEMLNQYKFKRIVVSCPHCLHTLGGEYKQYGGNYEVLHHSQFINNLGLTADAENATYHDPCYLGRWNGEFEAPRKVIGEVKEMPNNRNHSFCCGAGGGHAFMEEVGDVRVNHIRAKEAIATGAQTICTACPYCLTMMEDGIKTQGGDECTVVARDIAELVSEKLNKQN